MALAFSGDIIEVKGYLDPSDLVYRYWYPVGALQVTWNAVRDYCLEPAVEVESVPESDVALSALSNSWPSLKATVTGPDEFDDLASLALKQWKKGSTELEGQDYISVAWTDSIEVLMRAPVRKDDSEDTRLAFLREKMPQKFKELGEAEAKQEAGYRSLMRYYFARSLGATATLSRREHLQAHDHGACLPQASVDTISNNYGREVSAGIHALFDAP